MFSRLSMVAVFVLALVIGGVTLASAQGTVYHACVNNSSGTIFMRSGPDECKSNETYVYWNQIGPQGPTGPEGPQGDGGAVGPQGPTGVLGFYYRSQGRMVDAGETVTIDAVCTNVGDKMTGGGYEMFNSPAIASTDVLWSKPTAANTWTGKFTNRHTDTGVSISVFVVCADVTP